MCQKYNVESSIIIQEETTRRQLYNQIAFRYLLIMKIHTIRVLLCEAGINCLYSVKRELSKGLAEQLGKYTQLMKH